MHLFSVLDLGNSLKNFFKFFMFETLRLVNTILGDNASLKRKQYFSLIFFLFLFILTSNMVGLLPFSWSVTNSFVVTFYLSFAYFFAINFIALWRNG